ncbi:hypothetical protein SSX86_007499 [Deinandra increscens subsp. villosa]|uniref:Integrase catalytic domain-containing protein n=1 Tax=Deinandra increscens subsp. villosa TaxID=3103831 RepID=A0AAP0DHG6_9ASTR
MASSSTSESNLSNSAFLHTLKLSDDNYLLWKTQVWPLLSYQGLISHVDGTGAVPDESTTVDGKSVPNPARSLWDSADQKVVVLITGTLSAEAVAQIVGCTTARDIWVTLAEAYSSTSVERVQNLRDQLRVMSKGADSVAVFSRKFKAISDQLTSIGQTVSAPEKLHWYLCGLGAAFFEFSTTIRAMSPIPSFQNVVARAESHETFSRAVQGPATPPVAFAAQSNRGRGNNNNRSHNQHRNSRGNGRNFRPYRNNRGGRGYGSNRHVAPTVNEPCQLCNVEGRKANKCPTHVSYSASEAHLSSAFQSQCNVNPNSANWYVDSGATDHMANSPGIVSNPLACHGNNNVYFGNGTSLPISHKGHHILHNDIKLNDILVVPNLTKNLLSVAKLTNDNNIDVIFSRNQFFLQDRSTRQVLAQGKCEDGLYVLNQDHVVFTATSSLCNKASYELWHSHLGHASFDTIKLLNKVGMINVTALLPKPELCSPCQMSKSHRLPFDDNLKRASHPLEIVHCDLWGPAPITSHEGYKYYVAFIDDFSRFTWVYPLKTKAMFSNILVIFMNFVQNQLERKIKVFQSDGGTEFVNNKVKSLFDANGMFHRLSCPYTPQQNGRVERKHRHIIETGLAMMFNANVQPIYWVQAFSTAVYIINRLPTKVLGNTSPFECLFQQPPVYDNFHTFGCRVFPYLRDYSAHKLAPRSLPCIFLGYASNYKGFRCLEPTSNRVYITRHAKFDENVYPLTGSSLVTCEGSLPLTSFILKPPFRNPPVATESPPTTPKNIYTPCAIPDDIILPNINNSPDQNTPNSPPLNPPATHPQSTSPTPSQPSPSSPTSSAQTIPTSHIPNPSASHSIPSQSHAQPTPVPSHPMQTRAKSGIFKPRHKTDLAHVASHKLFSAIFSSSDPKTFKTASKHQHWWTAMDKEMAALKQNHTWTLVDRPPNTNVVGSKWLFKTKYRADGSVERYKARLVAQGFSQVPGLDFAHTFSPVVKATTIRIVLSLAVINGWKLHQLDVNNAFLHGNLSEKVYMEQPPGFVDPKYPNHVCLLHKALYGLKQAPRAWFQRLSAFLIQSGFTCSRADPSLFVFKRDTCILYLLVYVDDLILTGNQEATIDSFITRLHDEFAIKDLGELSYFLGLEVTSHDSGLFLSQSKYATDILDRAKMLDAKPMSTPLASDVTFTTAGQPFEDPTLYRSLVGALQYLTITRPDISYVVNQVSQFLQHPTVTHFQHVKRILRYIKGTLDFGLTFSRSKCPNILGYSDADWARCIETRRSTYGYSIYLGGNLVSWSVKKQPTVARSSCESEYRAMANTAAEIVWVTHLLRELHTLPPDHPTLLCDNQSAIFMSQNPVAHKRAKHIDIDYHFIRELVLSGQLYTKFIPTKLQVADIFTKSLSRPQFELFRTMLRLGSPPSRLRGDIST